MVVSPVAFSLELKEFFRRAVSVDDLPTICSSPFPGRIFTARERYRQMATREIAAEEKTLISMSGYAVLCVLGQHGCVVGELGPVSGAKSEAGDMLGRTTWDFHFFCEIDCFRLPSNSARDFNCPSSFFGTQASSSSPETPASNLLVRYVSIV